MISLVIAYPYLLARAGLAALHLRRRGGPGSEFSDFGRSIGARLLLRGWRIGAELLLRPVESVRYFEFPFTRGCCPDNPRRCLDVGSPRLFSLYSARRWPKATIRMINPDSQDVATTARIARELRITNLQFGVCGVEALATDRAQHDCIWSISVVEHIAGRYEDREAVRWMYDALAEGGRLILTVPVDRSFWEEYRDVDYYGTQFAVDRKHFFQRWYDRPAIWDRIVASIGQEPDVVAWFGERSRGHFDAYIRRWLQRGFFETVDDPRDVTDHYTTFPSWEAMPGQGVCGLMFEKRC